MLEGIIQFLQEFFPAAIATMVGCFVAFYLDRKAEKINIEREQKRIESDVIGEIKSVGECIECILNEMNQPGNVCYYLSPIKTPVYNGLVNTYKVSDFLQRKHEPQTEHSVSIADIYEAVSEINKWHTWRTDHRGNRDSCSFAEDHLRELTSEALEMIEAVLNNYQYCNIRDGQR